MSTISYPNGVGQALGDYLATTKPLQASGSVWYVNSATGTDAASPAGKNDSKPLATLGQAVTNASDGDIIALMDGHTETISAASLTINKSLVIIGGGLSGGLPTVKITLGGAAGYLIALQASGIQLRNIWFPTRAVAHANARVAFGSSGAHLKVVGCYFECGANDTGPALDIGNGVAGETSMQIAEIVNTTFVSTATSTSAQPGSAILGTGTITLTRLRMSGVVFDGGTVGWSNPYACRLISATPQVLEAEAISLLRGSDMLIDSATTGFVNVATSTAGCRVDW